MTCNQLVSLKSRGVFGFTVCTFISLYMIFFSPPRQENLPAYKSSLPCPFHNNLSVFAESIRGDDMDVQLEILDAFQDAMSAANLTYVMYGGSLVGSWRHHGFVPWDDDIDVLVPLADEKHIRRTLSGLAPEFLLSTEQGFVWKFYSNRSHPISSTSFSWPYIDISFYRSNATHLWDKFTGPNSKYCYPLEIVFPLRSRPFMNRTVQAPWDTLAVLTQSYDLETCKIGYFDHKKERHRSSEKQECVHCKLLETMYPFVHRVKVGRAGCNETLVRNGNEVLSWIYQEYENCVDYVLRENLN